jgi:hypothetical protein
VGVVDGPATEEVTSRMPGSQSVNSTNDLSERLHDANVAVLRIWQKARLSHGRSTNNNNFKLKHRHYHHSGGSLFFLKPL